MRDRERLAVEDARLQTVVKSNELVQRSRYKLSLLEQKIVLFLISKIRPEDEAFHEYQFHMRDLCQLMGISVNPKNYKNFRDAIQKLSDKSFWVETDTQEMLCRWVLDATITKGDGTVKIRLDDKLKPYLLQLQQQFTAFSLEYVLLMQNKYSIRIYELLKSYEYLTIYTVSVDEFKQRIQSASYTAYKDFRINILDPAIEEINKYTDLDIFVDPIREGHAIRWLEFSIYPKTGIGMEYADEIRRNAFDVADRADVERLKNKMCKKLAQKAAKKL